MKRHASDMTVVRKAFPESLETLSASSASKKILYESFLCQWASAELGVEVEDKIIIKKNCASEMCLEWSF